MWLCWCWTDYGTELELDEEGTRVSLTIVDTPGFGDQIDNEARFEVPILQFSMLAEKWVSVLPKSWATLSVNTTTSWPRSPELSVIPGLETIVCTPYSTLSPQRVMGKLVWTFDSTMLRCYTVFANWISSL